jgi:YggT family protein
MSDLGMAVIQLGGLVNGLINVYIWVLIIAALLSFVNPDPYNTIVQFLYRITNPAYMYVRKFMRTDFNGLDIAPLVLIIGLQILTIIVSLIFSSLARLV